MDPQDRYKASSARRRDRMGAWGAGSGVQGQLSSEEATDSALNQFPQPEQLHLFP